MAARRHALINKATSSGSFLPLSGGTLTGSLITGNPGSGSAIELPNTAGINWLDLTATSTEMLSFKSIASSGDPDFASVVLLANLDGPDAATTYTSEDSGTRTATFLDNAQLDTAQFKFGSSSAVFDGINDEITFPSHVDFDFGSGDMTVEFWVRPITVFNESLIQWGTAPFGLIYISSSNKVVFFTSSANTIFGTTTVTTNTWHHIALVRINGTFELFLDGSSEGTATPAIQTYGQAIIKLGVGTATALNGWLDDVRITKGIGRYTANFTPPTAAFPSFGTSAIEAFNVGDPSFLTKVEGSSITIDGQLSITGSVTITSRAAAAADVVGTGQLWVKNTIPTELWFTDDAGTDTQIV